MPDQAVPSASKPRFLPWLLLYALLIAYASTVVGPMGLHFVPMELTAAWWEFSARAFTWVHNGSDQRADWMGNLSMYVPFGFLLTGTLWPRRGAGTGAFAAICAAFVMALAFLLSVKFAQVFFPPRTVTLNYVAAQSCGAVLGIGAFALSHGRLRRLIWQGEGGARENLRHLLQLYSVALCVFLLMPLDFALSPNDLMGQIDKLPGILIAIPGAGRPPVVQAVLLAAGALATVPFGMLMVLGPRGRNRFLTAATARGFGWMALLLALSALLISGAPALLSLACRTAGIALGAWSVRRLVRQDPDQLMDRSRLLAVLAVLPYLFLLLAVNGLLSTHWRGPAEAAQTIYPLGLVPLFDYYIVTKAEAAKNIVAHAVMYAPIGLFVWLRGGRPSLALVGGLLLAFAVEAGRYLRPGLEGDINAVAVAGLAALLTARLMPGIWWMLEGVALPRSSRLPDAMPSWRERAAAASLLAAASAHRGQQSDDIEHF